MFYLDKSLCSVQLCQPSFTWTLQLDEGEESHTLSSSPQTPSGACKVTCTTSTSLLHSPTHPSVASGDTGTPKGGFAPHPMTTCRQPNAISPKGSMHFETLKTHESAATASASNSIVILDFRDFHSYVMSLKPSSSDRHRVLPLNHRPLTLTGLLRCVSSYIRFTVQVHLSSVYSVLRTTLCMSWYNLEMLVHFAIHIFKRTFFLQCVTLRPEISTSVALIYNKS